jgi:hypothetical protein
MRGYATSSPMLYISGSNNPRSPQIVLPSPARDLIQALEFGARRFNVAGSHCHAWPLLPFETQGNIKRSAYPRLSIMLPAGMARGPTSCANRNGVAPVGAHRALTSSRRGKALLPLLHGTPALPLLQLVPLQPPQ